MGKINMRVLNQLNKIVVIRIVIHTGCHGEAEIVKVVVEVVWTYAPAEPVKCETGRECGADKRREEREKREEPARKTSKPRETPKASGETAEAAGETAEAAGETAETAAEAAGKTTKTAKPALNGQIGVIYHLRYLLSLRISIFYDYRKIFVNKKCAIRHRL
jgi:hypothetical protein